MILMGYLPFAFLRWRTYNHAAMVRTTITKAFLSTDMKKNTRADVEM